MQHLTKKNPIPRIDFGPLPPNLDRRGIAEEETRRDLTKSYEQLLADSHHEITDPDPNRGPMVNLGFSNRRIAGITARAAVAMEASAQENSKSAAENIKLQEAVAALNVKLLGFTKVVIVFTIIATIAGCIQAYYSWASYSLAKTSRFEQAAKEKAALLPPPSKPSK